MAGKAGQEGQEGVIVGMGGRCAAGTGAARA